MTLSDAACEPQRQHLTLKEAYADVCTEFSRRTVTLLMMNDLRGAVDAAAVAFWAAELAEGRGHRTREVKRKNQRIVGQGPAAAESGVAPRLAHLQALQ